MVKASIDLFRVHKSCKVSFGIILKNDITGNNTAYGNHQVVSKFSIKTTEYLKISPHPFINIDISNYLDKREDKYNINLNFTLNRRDLYLFMIVLKDINTIMDEKITELYYYDDKEDLQINKEKAEEYKRGLKCGNKGVIIQPTVVLYEEISEKRDIGVTLAINYYANFIYLTLEDLKYLTYELSKLDLNLLSIAILNSSELLKYMEANGLNFNIPPVAQTISTEITDIKPRVKITESIPSSV